jgi:hypothetical protein
MPANRVIAENNVYVEFAKSFALFPGSLLDKPAEAPVMKKLPHRGTLL